MKIKVFGCGAAGNKASIKLIEEGIIDRKNVRLFNTTLKDIPDSYKDLGVRYGNMDGCGKERTVGQQQIEKHLKNGSIDLLSYLEGADDEMVIIVTSTEGGSGSGAAPSMAKLLVGSNVKVHLFAFIGFNNETRGVKNTISFFKSLPEGIILHTIKNEDYLDYTGNLLRAEVAANAKFVEDVKILSGAYLLPSEQNMDSTDLFKIATTKGYMDIKKISLNGVKSLDIFNKTVKEAYDASTCMDYNADASRLAVIINASDKVLDNIDHNFEVIQRYIGSPYETFRHVQYDNSEEYMYVIAGGMSMGDSDIINLATSYKKLNEAVVKNKNKSIAGAFGGIDIDDDDEFDMENNDIEQPDVDSLFNSTVSEKVDAIARY